MFETSSKMLTAHFNCLNNISTLICINVISEHHLSTNAETNVSTHLSHKGKKKTTPLPTYWQELDFKLVLSSCSIGVTLYRNTA